MKRFHQLTLTNWIAHKPCKPLLIRGARQVGKTTLVRQFAQELNLTLIEINLEKYPELEPIFASLNIKKIISYLEGILKQDLSSQLSNKILFLDEIQSTPSALAALRYFYEEYTELAVIASGSLLEFTLSQHQFSMPVGRIQYLHLGPLNFNEFLLALNENYLLNALEEYHFKKEIPETLHASFIEKLKEYFIIGGMPEAVYRYSKEKNFFHIYEIHSSIIETYKDDFNKYSKKTDHLKMRKIFEQVPSFMGKKVKYTHFSQEYSSKEIKNCLELLQKALLLFPVYHSDSNGIPLGAQVDESVFKLYFIDIGLLNHLLGIQVSQFNKLSNIDLINAGVLAEQFASQQLISQIPSSISPKLFYWLRDGKKGNAEIDFVIQHGLNLWPLEIKAAQSGSLKSLMSFVYRKKLRSAIRFDLNPASVQHIQQSLKLDEESVDVEYDLYSLPLYLISQLNIILEQLDSSKQS